VAKFSVISGVNQVIYVSEGLGILANIPLVWRRWPAGTFLSVASMMHWPCRALSTSVLAPGLGNLPRFLLNGGERHDIIEEANLIKSMPNVGSVVADKAFDATSFLECIEAMNATAVIPPRANRKEFRCHDKHFYKGRNPIERFFAFLKQFHRIATRYDKLDIPFEAFSSIAAALICLA